MASLIQPNVLPNRNNHNAYDTPSQTRGMTLANSSGLRGSAWSSITNIWQSTPQGQSTRPVGSLAPVSPTRSDSLTAPDSPQDRPERGAIGVAMGSRTHPLRSTNSSAVSAPSSNGGRSSYPTESPPRQRPSGFLSAQANSNMPHLGTAMLLNGSAPDIDLGLRTTYSSTRAPENRLQAINVGGIDEFVPASQQYHSRSRPSMLRMGNEWTPASHQLSLGLNASFMPNRQSNGGMLDSYGNGYNSTAAPLEEAWNQLSNANNTAGLASQPSFQGQSLTAALTSLHLSDIHQQRPNQSFSDSRGLGHPSHSVQHGDISGHGVLVNASSDPSDSRDPGYMTPQLSYQNANHDSSTLHGNKAFASSAGGGMYTPSYTPPTAPGSRRSNSGSGTSTRASSQSVDTGSAFFPNRPSGFPFSHTPAGNDFIPHAPASFNSAFMAPQNRMLRSYEGHSQRLSPSESRIQQEKEQNLSPLIKDFRANYKTKRYELKDAYNHIVEFSGDQHGSRFIQAKLETANSEEKEKVFAEIQENALQLMTDIFGNYVIQKMFEHGTQAQKKILANQMRGRVYYLTTQVYGCRVVQKALEHVLTDQQASMVKELEGNVLGIVENQNGNHVIQKAIERVPGEHIQFVFDAHIGHVVRLSKHNYGCRVVQRILEYGPPAVKRAVLGELREAIPILIEDQFGNYVMQHIIRNGELSDRRIVVTLILQQLLHFSKHKFASNVVEAAIECAEEEQRQEILRKLIWDTDSHGQSQVHGLIRDQYGNYVIQKVLTMLQGAALNDLIHEIQHHLVSLRKISHGKQVSAMEKALADAIVSLGSQYQGHESLLPRGGTEIQSRSSALGRGPARYVVAPGPRLHAHM